MLETAITDYVTRLTNAIQSIDVAQLEAALGALRACALNGNRVYVIGNGGSAASANHFACDLSYGVKTHPSKSLKIQSLASNASVLTALANDYNYDAVFEMEVERLAVKGDVLIAISASGESLNVCRAVELAKTIGVITIGLSGFGDQNSLAKMADIAIHCNASKDEYGVSEDAHMSINHIFVEILKRFAEID